MAYNLHLTNIADFLPWLWVVTPVAAGLAIDARGSVRRAIVIAALLPFLVVAALWVALTDGDVSRIAERLPQ